MKCTALSLLLLLVSPFVALSMLLDGKYLLQSLYDDHGAALSIPDGAFTLSIEHDANEKGRYNFGLKIGNNMGGSMTVDDEGGVKIGPMRSTMMMPPPAIYALETELNKIMPALTTVALEGQKLTLDGSKGKGIFEKE